MRPEGAGQDVVALIDTAARQKDGPSLWCLRDAGKPVLVNAQFDSAMTILWPESGPGKARVLQGDDRAKVTFLGRVVWCGTLRDAG